MTTAERLFEDAISKVESDEIRNWANSEQNRDLWIKYTQDFLKVSKQGDLESFLAGMIVATAIGL
jgi:hypothetical protein